MFESLRGMDVGGFAKSHKTRWIHFLYPYFFILIVGLLVDGVVKLCLLLEKLLKIQFTLLLSCLTKITPKKIKEYTKIDKKSHENTTKIQQKITLVLNVRSANTLLNLKSIDDSS